RRSVRSPPCGEPAGRWAAVLRSAAPGRECRPALFDWWSGRIARARCPWPEYRGCGAFQCPAWRPSRVGMIDKRSVAQVLEQIAAFMELKGESAFRVRAFTNAARIVNGFPEELDVALES